MAPTMNRLILQSDWDSSLREPDGKAWVSFKGSAGPSQHSEVTGHGLSSNGLLYLSTESSMFKVSDITKKSLVVSFEGEEASLSRKFVAPSIAYHNIHKQRKQITCVDVTPDGLGVSCDSEGKLKMWETSSGEVRRNLEGHVGDVYTCRFFPSHIVVLTAGADMMAKIWCAKTGNCAATITGHKAAIMDTAIIERGRNIVTASRDGTVKLWDVSKQACLATVEAESGDINSCAVAIPDNSLDMGPNHPDKTDQEVGTEGKMLLVGTENGSVYGYSLQSRQQIFSVHNEAAVNVCSFVSDVFVVWGTQDGNMSVMDLRNTSSPLTSWRESRGPILSLLPHKGGFFASTGDGSCFHVNERWETTTELTGSDCDPIYHIASDGSNIYTSCRDGAIRRYSLSYV